MKQDIVEQLSAAMDGELVDAERGLLLRRLASDAELKARWTRFHLIGDTLSGRLAAPITPDLAQRVMCRIDPLPVARIAPHRQWQRVLRPVGGFAIAASVAAIAVIGLQRWQDTAAPSSAPRVATLQRPASTLPAAAATPVAVANRNVWLRPGSGLPIETMGYVQGPGGTAFVLPVQGVLPYVQIVGFAPAE